MKKQAYEEMLPGLIKRILGSVFHCTGNQTSSLASSGNGDKDVLKVLTKVLTDEILDITY